MDVSKFLSKILSTAWFYQPQKLIAYGSFIKGLMDGTIKFEEIKLPLGAYAISPTGDKMMLYDSEEVNDNSKPASIFDRFPENSTLIIPLKDIMFKEDDWWDWGTVTIASYIREAADHDNINAIIIETDSGGGTVDSIFPIVDAILYAKTKKPVIAWADTAASAAYYSIAATDLIIASNNISSEFGSIGVMVSFMDIAPMWEKQGVKFHTIYAPESNFKNLAWENALKGDYKLMMEEVLSPLAQKFQADVREFRAGKVDITQKGILNGRMFYANDAIKYGLADEMGNLDYAVKRAIQMAAKRNK
jgi:protease-4